MKRIIFQKNKCVVFDFATCDDGTEKAVNVSVVNNGPLRKEILRHAGMSAKAKGKGRRRKRERDLQSAGGSSKIKEDPKKSLPSSSSTQEKSAVLEKEVPLSVLVSTYIID